MADVRLTATNPEDSSVVPVACNSKGELLVDKPVIEQIDNDVMVHGSITTEGAPEASPDDVIQLRMGGNRMLYAETNDDEPALLFQVGWNGSLTSGTSVDRGNVISASFMGSLNCIYAKAKDNTYPFSVDYDGNCFANDLTLPSGQRSEDWVVEVVEGEEVATYKGPVINVRDELVFLRAQVRALMEKLKMSPEGGWPVWDGSDET